MRKVKLRRNHETHIFNYYHHFGASSFDNYRQQCPTQFIAEWRSSVQRTPVQAPNTTEGTNSAGTENRNQSIEEIVEQVKVYRRDAIIAAEAHLASAEYHRSRDMRLGVAAILLSTLISTAVFSGIAKRFTLSSDGKLTQLTPESGRLTKILVWGGFLSSSILLVAAPTLTAVHKFMHNAEDAASHNVSSSRYDRLARQYDLFLAQYAGAQASKRDEVIKALRDLDTQYGAAREKNITLTEEAKEDAGRIVANRQKAIASDKN
jgi:hypothetical protein